LTLLLRQLRSFYARHMPSDMEHMIRVFSLFGSLEWELEIDKPIKEIIEKDILSKYDCLKKVIDEKINYDQDLANLLHAVAIGDRKMFSSFKRAGVSENRGGQLLNILENLDILEVDYSREAEPVKAYPSQKLKREVARNRITHKLSFKSQFIRFWFYFIKPFEVEIQMKRYDNFFDYFDEQMKSYISYTFEELSNLLLNKIYKKNIVECGSYWDRKVEIDVLAFGENGDVIVGECKWKNHKITKNELSKLQDKCKKISLHVDTYVLFSKSGFSNELLKNKNEKLLLYTPSDFEILVKNVDKNDLIESEYRC
jgi:uncharacterized protein